MNSSQDPENPLTGESPYQQHLDVAIQAARRAGGILSEMYRKVKAREKGPKDLVTDADIAAQRAIVDVIRETFPDHAVLAEEEGLKPAAGATNPWRWIIDPLDGTINYAHGFFPWCVSIALEHQGTLVVGVIYVPVGDTLYTAIRGCGTWENGRQVTVSPVTDLADALTATGFPTDFAKEASQQLGWLSSFSAATHSVRRTGSSAWNLAQVATGAIEVCYIRGLQPWDAAAGVVLVEAAGGKVSRLDGSAYNVDGHEILATNARVHSAAVSCLRNADTMSRAPGENPKS